MLTCTLGAELAGAGALTVGLSGGAGDFVLESGLAAGGADCDATFRGTEPSDFCEAAVGFTIGEAATRAELSTATGVCGTTGTAAGTPCG
jgi:hypothetical protein